MMKKWQLYKNKIFLKKELLRQILIDTHVVLIVYYNPPTKKVYLIKC